MKDLTENTMSVQEARECIEKIKVNVINIRELIFDLNERRGWAALGYKSWEKCVTSEFKEKERYLYYQLAAAKTEKSLIHNNCTTVQQIGSIPERHLRPLTHLAPDQQREVWEEAVKTAPEGKVTAKHVEKVVEEHDSGRTRPKDPNIDPPEVISDKFKQTFNAFLSAIKNEKALKWKTTSKKDALKYVEILKDIILI